MNATRKNCTKSSISKYCTHATVSHKILPFDACLNSMAGVPTSRINNCAWNRVTYNGINQRNTCIVLFTWRDFKHFYITTLKKKKKKKGKKWFIRWNDHFDDKHGKNAREIVSTIVNVLLLRITVTRKYIF